jgi:hypothetical protein
VTADAPEDEPDDESEDDEPLEPESLDEAEPERSEAPLDELPVSVLDEEGCCAAVEVCDAVPAVEVVDGVPAVEVFDVVPAPLAVAVWFVAPSAGSCPVTRRPNITAQAARKTESVIAMTRRRMVRARCLRARTRWRARIRPSSGEVGGGVEIGVCMAGSIAPRRESAVGGS